MKEELEKEGFTVMRSSGSHTLFDLVAFDHFEIRFIQVKTNKNMKALNSILNKTKIELEKFIKDKHLISSSRPTIEVWGIFKGKFIIYRHAYKKVWYAIMKK